MLPAALLLILVKLISETGKVEFISAETIMMTDIIYLVSFLSSASI